jgi:hypothetical protein
LPRDAGQYILDTDASLHSVAACLSQEQDGEIRAIAYASRSLNRHERNYCTTRREALALQFGLKIFSKYLLNRKVIARCVHMALLHYRSTPQPMHQVARHLEFLDSFDLEIQYRKGEQHVNADFLSRLPPCNRGPDGEPCRQCNRRMLGHSLQSSHRISAIGRSGAAEGQLDAFHTRSGRHSRPRLDSNFIYQHDWQRRRAAALAVNQQSIDNATCSLMPSGDCMGDERAADGVQLNNESVQPLPSSLDIGDANTANVYMADHTTDQSPCRYELRQPACAEAVQPVRSRRRAQIVSQLARRAPLAVAALKSQSWDPEFLSREQEADVDIATIYASVKSGNKPLWDSIKHLSPTTRALFQQWDSLLMINNVLYRQFYDPTGSVKFNQLVLPSVLKMPFLELIHNDTASHQKFGKCAALVERQAWWLTWRRDLKWFIACCDACQAYHNGRPPRQALLQPLLQGAPRERWSVDLSGPFRKDKHGFVYMLSCIDCFTRYAVVVPLRNKEATTVAAAIILHVFAYHGFGDLQADRGGEF